MTYAGGVDIDSIDPMLRRATQLQITHYGQTPLQLLTSPHPARGPVPLPPPRSLPLSPAAAVLAALLSGALLSPQRSKGADGASAVHKPSSSAMSKVLRRPAQSDSTSSAKTAKSSGLAPGAGRVGGRIFPVIAARSLTLELRRYAAIVAQSTTGYIETSFTVPVESQSTPYRLPSPAVMASALSGDTLPFELVVNKSFGHICNVPGLGSTFWRPDSPGTIPLGLYSLFGPSLIDVFRDNKQSPYITLSFGDVMVAAGAPPPGTLSLRVLLADLPRVVDLRGPKGDPWPRAFPDPYTTTPEQAFSRGVQSVGELPPPFALPIGYHMVCLLVGSSIGTVNGAVSGGNGSENGARGAMADAVAESEPGGAAPVAAGPSRFHVWWPVAPNGYVALGAVVTPATWVLVQKAVAPSSSASGITSPQVSAPMSPIPSAHAAPLRSSQEGAARSVFVNTLRPTTPEPGAAICVHVSLCQKASFGSFAPMAWYSVNVPPRPREEQVVLRGWQGKAANSTADCPPGGARSSELLQPEDEWMIVEPDNSGPGIPPIGASGLHILPDASAPLPIDTAEADVAVSGESTFVAPASASSEGAGSAITAAGQHGLTSAKIAKLRASKSRAAAFYGVNNHVGTFVLPVPVSIQRVTELQARIDAAIASQRCQVENCDSRGNSSDTLDHLTVSRQVSLDLDELLALSAASSAQQDHQHYQHQEPVQAGRPDSVKEGPATTVGGSYQQDIILASTALPPVPEHADATFAKAHALASAVAYDLGTALLQRVRSPPEDDEDETAAFAHQHWGATSEVVCAEHGIANSGPRVNVTPVEGALPNIVAVRVINSAQLGAALASDIPGISTAAGISAGMLSAAPHTIIAVDARGGIHRCRVSAVPSHTSRSVQAFVDHSAAQISAFMGLPANSLRVDNPAGATSVLTPSLVSQLMPRVTVRILKESVPAHAPVLPLQNSFHSYSMTSSSSEACAGRGSVRGSVHSTAKNDSLAVLPCFPVATTDMLCGGLVFIGCGFGRGFDAYAIDFRQRISLNPLATGATATAPLDAPVLPPVPFAPRASAGASAAGGRKGLVSSVVGSMAGVALGVDTTGATTPLWAGVATSESGAVVVGALGVPGSTLHSAASVLCIDGDLFAAGFTDGIVRVWRLAGIEGPAIATAWPSVRPRPDAVLAGPSSGPVLSLALSRDEDLLIAGYAGEVWLYEVARARPLQVLRLEAPAAFDPAIGDDLVVTSSPALCTAACIVASGGILVASCSQVSRGDASMWVSELILFSPAVSASTTHAEPRVRVSLSARVTCLLRVRGGGIGDWEGAGALVVVGRSDGIVSVLDTLDLTTLVTWETPGHLAVYSLDLSPCGSFLVAGCSQGTLAVFALPGLPASVPLDSDAEADANLLESLVTGVAALSSAALTQVDSAKGVAKAAKAIADEASSVVRGLFGSLWGGGGVGAKQSR